MLRLVKLGALSPVVLLSLTSAAFAGGLFDWWSTDTSSFPSSRKKYHSGREWPLASRPVCEEPEPCIQQYHTQHYWPDPYRWQDRCNVRSVLAGQAERGWVQATTLYDQHFDPDTQELNLAGRERLKWILLHAPAERRQPWVQIGPDTPASQIRLASVTNAGMNLAGGTCPTPMLRVCTPVGQNGQEADTIRRKYLSTAPDPRIPFASQAAGAQGSSGGSSSPSQ